MLCTTFSESLLCRKGRLNYDSRLSSGTRPYICQVIHVGLREGSPAPHGHFSRAPNSRFESKSWVHLRRRPIFCSSLFATGACGKNAPDTETLGSVSSKSTTSEDGERFLLPCCGAEARVKVLQTVYHSGGSFIIGEQIVDESSLQCFVSPVKP